jgi:uncharacterized protein (DUF1810 family)
VTGDLQRFLMAQNRAGAGYADALAEIRAGGKQSHWIWYVFPQLYGLGSSSAARAYGIRGTAEAIAYLRDDTLRERLIEIAGAVHDQLRRRVPLETLMGSSIDVLKLVSSLTLFGGVARMLACDDPSGRCEQLAVTADAILAAATAAGYPPCQRTLDELASTT